MPIIDSHAFLEGYLLPGYNQQAGQVAQQMQARSVDRTILISARAVQADPISGNRILRAMLDQAPGLYGCLTAHLNRVDASLQAIRELMSSRKMVAIMLTSTVPDEPLHLLVADEVLNACRRYQKPIYLNTPNAACVDVALQLAKTYPMHKFVMLGMGGADWRTAIAAAHQSVNIFLETSGAMDRSKIPAAVELLGAHRILFGSGSPHRDPVAAVGLLEDSEVSEGDARRILHDNAYRLFNLEVVDEE